MIALQIDAEALAETQKLDGCYVLKTDLTPRQADQETIHRRYKDLSLVEWGFRTSKTVELELRPIHVRRKAKVRLPPSLPNRGVIVATRKKLPERRASP